MTPEYAAQTRTLAANQGLYNGFIAAGLVWGLLHPVAEFATQIQLFFLGCVGIAGVFGGVTVNPRILFIQTVPAIVATTVLIIFC
jgi:putative membrane protein